MRTFSTRPVGTPPNYSWTAKTVAVGDFNNDGIPDLAVGAGNLQIHLGTGSGAFRLAYTYPVSDPRSIVTGDFNADGNLDLIAGGQVLLGDGTGHFSPVQLIAPTEQLAVGDFDGDGILDVAAVDYYGNNLVVWRGAGDGAFSFFQTLQIGSTTGPFQHLVARSGDFNGDGIDDLAVENTGDGQIGIILGSALGQLTVAYAPRPGTFGGDLHVGDFNGDGHLDLVAEASSSFGNPVSLFVLIGVGDGTFQMGSSFRAGYQIEFDVGDFTGDGKLDIALNKSVDSDYTYGLFVYPGNGDGTFGSSVNTLIPPAGYPMLLAADVNSDGRTDLVIPGFTSDTFIVLLGLGNGHFEEAPRYSTGVGSVQGIASADFNGDGIPDVAVTGFIGEVAVLLGTGSGGFQPPQVASVPSQGPPVVADFNHDGKMDVVVADGSDGLYVLLGAGDGTFGMPIKTQKDNGNSTLVVGDFDKDGNPDVIVNTGTLVLFGGRGDGTFQPPATISTLVATSMAVGDVDGDGNPDLVITVSTYASGPVNTLYVFLGKGDGTFSPPIASSLDDTVTAVALHDMDNDGKMDAVVLYPYMKTVGVLLGDGAGSFGPSIHADFDGFYRTMDVADFNGDGRADLVLSGQDNVAVMAGTGGGHLGAARLFTLPGTPVGAVAGNFDADSKPDIAVACQGTVYTPPDFVAMLRNTSCEARRLSLVTNLPACSPPATPFTPQPVVQVVDDGDSVSACAGGSVTASIVPGTGTAGAVLGGTTTEPLASGIAAFSGLSIGLSGTGYVLEFSHPMASATRSRGFTVGTAPAVAISGPSAICNWGSFTATAGFDTYVWSVDGVFAGTRSTLFLSGPLVSRGAHVLQVVATKDGCTASASVPLQVVDPDATITVPAQVCPFASDVSASVPDAGPGATYFWDILNGVITSGAGTRSIQFHTGPAGVASILAIVSDSGKCTNSGMQNIEVTYSGCPPPIGFFTVTPCRILDTRNPAGPYGGPALPAGLGRSVVLAGQCGIPTDATAVATNLTVTESTAAGFLVLYPSNTPFPVVSTINYSPGQTRANNAVVSLGAAGDVEIDVRQISGTIQVILDVTGYFR